MDETVAEQFRRLSEAVARLPAEQSGPLLEQLRRLRANVEGSRAPASPITSLEGEPVAPQAQAPPATTSPARRLLAVGVAACLVLGTLGAVIATRTSPHRTAARHSLTRPGPGRSHGHATSSHVAAGSGGAAPTLEVGTFPTGIAFDAASGTIYVGAGGSPDGTVTAIDAATCNAETTSGCSSTRSIPTGGGDPIGVAVDEATHTLYVVNADQNTVAVFDAETCNATTTSGCPRSPPLVKVGDGVEFLAVDPATNTIYTANSDTVSVIDGNRCDASVTTGCSAAPATVNIGPGGFPIGVDDATNTIYVGTNSGVAVIDGARCDSSDASGCSAAPVNVPIGNEPAGFAIDDADHTVYVSGESGTVALIDSATCNGRTTSGCGRAAANVSVGSDPRGDWFDAATGTLYSTDAGSNVVSMINVSKCNATSTAGCSTTPPAFPAGSSPRRLVVDPSNGTLYVVNTLAGTVSVVDESTCNASTQSGCPSASPPGTGTGGGGSFGPPPLAGGGGGAGSNSDCGDVTSAASSGGPPPGVTSGAKQVASGTVEGLRWTLWSKDGQSGANGLEEAGLVLGGRSYGLCPGYANPAEMEMIDLGKHAVVYGVVGYPGKATVQLNVGKTGTFDRGAALPTPPSTVVNGVDFFIGTLPEPACSYPSIEMSTTSRSYSAQHNLGFGSCTAGKLVPITYSQGVWDLAPGHFQLGF